MRDFKVMKELVKALTYIGDAIAGNVKTSADNSKEYDGLEKIPTPENQVDFITCGLTIDENANFSKLGDVFSDNVINDINYLRESYNISEINIVRKYDIRSDVSALVSVAFDDSSDLVLRYYYDAFPISGKLDPFGIAFRIELSASTDDLTKDTLLTKITAG